MAVCTDPTHHIIVLFSIWSLIVTAFLSPHILIYRATANRLSDLCHYLRLHLELLLNSAMLLYCECQVVAACQTQTLPSFMEAMLSLPGKLRPPWEGFKHPAFPEFSCLNAKCNQDCRNGNHNVREQESFHTTGHVKPRTGDLGYLEGNSHGWSNSDLIPSRTH